MTRTEALLHLSRMTAASDESAPLDAAALDLLVDLAQRPDVDGVLPGEVGWVETYNLPAAAVEGWRWKAANAAAAYQVAADGQTFSRQQIAARCLEMADRYARLAATSVTTGSDS